MPAWTPASITTALWLDASDASTLYDATSGGSLVAADGAVARWQDKSGNARHVTQSTVGSRPLRKTSIQNSLDVVRFDGSNDGMDSGASDILRNVSWGAIYCVRKITAVSGTPWLIGVGTNAAATTVRALMDINRGGTSKCGSGGRRLDADSFQSVQGATTYSTSAFQLQVAVFNHSATTLQVRLNGSVDGQSTSFQTAGSTSDTVSAGINIGANPGAAWFNGDIAEIIVASSAADSEKIEGYLAWKWGLQTSLSSDHPYRYAQPDTQWRFPNLRGAVLGYIAGRDTGSAASDRFTVDGTQDGTLTNGATRVNDGGLAYSFDGVNDYISTSAVITAAAPFTIAAWAKPSNLTAIHGVAGAANAGLTNGWSLRLRGDLAGDPWQFTGFGVGDLNSSASGTTNWQHVAVTLSGTTATIYVNGVSSGGTTMSVSATTSAMFVGARNQAGTPNLFFGGCIDDVLVYQRALTATEIANLASARGAAYQQTGTRRRRSTMGAGIL